MTHDFLNDLQVGFVLAEASAECVPQDTAAKLWQKNRVTIFFLRLGFFFLIVVCTNRADSAVDGVRKINLAIASAENEAGVPINFIGTETNNLLILVFFQKSIDTSSSIGIMRMPAFVLGEFTWLVQVPSSCTR